MDRSLPGANNRPRRVEIAVRRFRTAMAVLVLGLCMAGLTGCEKQTTEPKLKAAREFLARDKNQNAVDTLNGVGSADACFLRSIALFRLGLEEAAREQTTAAITADSSNPLYLAFDLRTKTLDAKTDREARADELLQICKSHASEPAFALFAATGYGAKGDAKSAVTSFRTAVALSEQIPEFWPEMLNMAVSTNCLEEADRMIAQIEKVNPDDPYLKKQKVLVLLANRKFDQALTAAREEYERSEHAADAAMMLAQAISASPRTEEGDKTLADLVHRHPGHTSLVIHYGTYLAKTGRLPLALAALNETLTKLTKEQQPLLLPILISLPLEVGDAAEAERQLIRHRAALGDATLALYYDARIQFLRKEYSKAAQILATVAKSLQAGNRPDQRKMLQEAAFWLQKALWEQAVTSRINQAIKDATQSPEKKESAEPPGPSPGAEKKVEGTEKPAAGPDAAKTAQ